jgi:hypothetical protein
MLRTRIQHVLTMVIALFFLGASSQAAVCELACGLQVHPAACHAGMEATSVSAAMPGMVAHPSAKAPKAGMEHAHCSHAITMSASVSVSVSATSGLLHNVSSSVSGSCSHTAVAAFDKSGASSPTFAAVQWITVSVVPFDRMLPASYAGAGKHPSLVLAGVDPLVVSLRV